MNRRRLQRLGVVVALFAGVARAEPKPTLDDFYDRTRGRADGFGDCLGYCDGEHVAAFLIGAQVADPSTDAVQRAVAYGGRLGIDLGTFFGRYDVARSSEERKGFEIRKISRPSALPVKIPGRCEM